MSAPSPTRSQSRLHLALTTLALGIVFTSLFELARHVITKGGEQSLDTLVPISKCLTFLLLGVILVAHSRGTRRYAWLAILPGFFTLLQLSRSGFSLPKNDEFAPPMLTAGILLASFSLPITVFGPIRRTRALVMGMCGSLVVAAAIAGWVETFLGLPPYVRLIGATHMQPLAALLLVALGLSLALLSLLEQPSLRTKTPAWLPIPAVVATAALSLILWIAHREREWTYIGANTTITINSLDFGLDAEVQRLARGAATAAKRIPAAAAASPSTALLNEALADTGALDYRLLSPDGKVLWHSHPETSDAGDPEPASRTLAALIAEASRTAAPAFGFARGVDDRAELIVVTPWIQGGKTAGFLELDYDFRKIVDQISKALRIPSKYVFSIGVDDQSLYSTLPAKPESDLTIESRTLAFHPKGSISMSPAPGNTEQMRRNLPEITLVAGFAISVLLGLSIHLARTAQAGLAEARSSNDRLRDEIEERKKVEAMLTLADERLRLALDSTQIAIFEWSEGDEDLYFSPGLWTMLGYQYEPFRVDEEGWIKAIHPDDRDAYQRATQNQLSGSTPFADPEYRVRGADGGWRWIYTRARTVESHKDGRPTRIIGTLQDITGRKSAEDALRLSQAATRKLSLVAAHTDNIVIIAKADGSIEWVNHSFERLMEYRLEEVVGKNPEELVSGPETNPRTLKRIKAAMKRGTGVSTDVVNYSKSGKKYHLHLEIQPVFSQEGVLENFIAIQADISARVETEHNLRRAKAEADAASKAKSEFLASMSHEIRTPMNGVIGMTSLLLETPLNAEQRDFVSTIRNSGEALLTIINDILDFSKIESGKMELERMPFELASCVEDALDLFAVTATAKHIDLSYHIESDVPPWIQGDITRLRQVLVNLVNNAVKFTPAGRISVTVKRIPGQSRAPGALPETVELEISIIDSGIGIPPERMDRLFKPFTQVDSSTTRKYGGTGLGLAICQRLCSLMGGSMSVTSTVGVGSTFSFRIVTPAVPVPPGWGLPESPAQLNYGPVLCVTENPVTLARLNDFFMSWGGRIMPAPSLDEALVQFQSDPPPIAAIVDHALVVNPSPFRDALVNSELHALLMTPPGHSISAMEAFAGRRALIPVTKPVRTSALVRAFRKLLSPARESIPPFSPSVMERLLGEEIPLDVLLVEDNPVNQKVGLRFLERLGYRADAAGNGLEAVNALESRPYHLILMDLQMPEMDGLEASRQIRRRLPAERQPKIIALTANALQGDKEICMAAGMDDYITKPVKPMEIAKAIRRHFGKPNARVESEDEAG